MAKITRRSPGLFARLTEEDEAAVRAIINQQNITVAGFIRKCIDFWLHHNAPESCLTHIPSEKKLTIQPLNFRRRPYENNRADLPPHLATKQTPAALIANNAASDYRAANLAAMTDQSVYQPRSRQRMSADLDANLLQPRSRK